MSKIMGIWLEESNVDSAKGIDVSTFNTQEELVIKIDYSSAINLNRAQAQPQLTQYTSYLSTTILESSIFKINNISETTQQS
jgi:hypothetical protein